jgi:hypothetical protein
VLEKHVAQVFYVPNITNKRLKVIIPRKWWIIRVENVIDEEEFDQFDKIPAFITPMIKPRIPSTNEAPFFRNDHHEKVKNFKKPRPQQKVAKWLCKICSMCGNMTICVKSWVSLDICVKYTECGKVWPFVWKFDFHWIFVWNMLNVWKYDHFCENLTFIGYLCEICSMCEICSFVWKFYFHWIFVWNMLNVWKHGHLMSWLCFWSVCSFWSLVVQFLMDTILNLTMCSVCGEEKGRRVLTRCISHLRKRETHTNKAHLAS